MGRFVRMRTGISFPIANRSSATSPRWRTPESTPYASIRSPPRSLLDIAHRHGLKVMVGLPWEQHIAFLDEAGRAESIALHVRNDVRSCAGHPALLCYASATKYPPASFGGTAGVASSASSNDSIAS
jgi:hypothetical protein